MRIFIVITVLATLAISYACEKSKTATVPEPKELHRVMDNASLLTTEQEESLSTISQDLEKNIGSQIAVLTIDTLNGESINEFSLRTANEMGLGRKDYDDGILITVAAKDKSIRIEVGVGLEKIIEDEIAAGIISDDMVPRFKEGDYFNGIKAALEKIKRLIEENKELVGQRP